MGYPLYLTLNRVGGFTSEAIDLWACASLLHSTHVISDGIGCIVATTCAICNHAPKVVGTTRRATCLSSSGSTFKWVNIVLGKLKTPLSGAFRAVKDPKFGEYFRAAFA